MTQRFASAAVSRSQQAVLGQVDVLVLVDRYPAIARLHLRQDFGMVLQKLDGQGDEVVEVEGVGGGEGGLVELDRGG